jgi:putative FmdB family regulatory protein
MPIYEFECGQCHNIFEELVMNTGDTDIHCPKCNSRKVHKLISRTGDVSSAGMSSGSSCGSSAPTGFS